MDLDDKVLHYALWFGGMTVASALHHTFDMLGLNLVNGVKNLILKLKKPKA